jgi:hypothetical protein
VLGLVLACAVPEDDTASWTPDVPVAPQPTVDVAAVGAAVTDLVAGLRDLGAAPVFEAYRVAMEAADSSCPGVLEELGSASWGTTCTTAAGAAFAGFAFLHHYDETVEEDSDIAEGDTMRCIGDITLPDGTSFGCHGTAWNYLTLGEGTTTFTTAEKGAYFSTLAGTADAWLAGDPDPFLEMIAVRSDDGTRSITVDGAVGGLPDDTLADGYVRALTVADATCPEGGVSVRDSAGEWYDVAFGCDPCGAVSFRGTALGTTCVDFAPLLDWTDTPW